MNDSCFSNLFHVKLPAHRITLSVFYIISSFTASALNLLIILTIWRTPSLQKPSNILLGNLAITDFIVAILGNPLIVVTNLAALCNWVQVFCYCWVSGRLVIYWVGSNSLYTLAIISVDRLLAILLKGKYRTVVTVRRIVTAAVCFWIFSGVIMVPIVITTATEPRMDIYISVLAASVFVLLTMMTVCYGLSYYRLKRVRVAPETPATNSTQIKCFRPLRYRRLLNTMVLILCIMFLFYLPYVCSAITTVVTYVVHGQHPSFEERVLILYRFMTISELFVSINSTVNPLLYLWRMKKLRDGVYIMFKRNQKVHCETTQKADACAVLGKDHAREARKSKDIKG